MRRRRKKTDFYKYLFLRGKKESEVAQSCQTVCDLPGSSIHDVLQARILEWVAIPFSRGSSQPRDRTQVSRIAGRCFTLWAIREARIPRRKLVSNWNPNSGTFSQAQLNTSSICTRKEMQFKSSLLSYTQRWVLPLLLTPIIQKTQPPAPSLCYSTPTLICTYSFRVTQRETLSSFQRIVFFPTFCVQRTMSHNPPKIIYVNIHGFPMVLVGKNPPAKSGDIRDVGLIPGLGRSPGEGNGNPLQYSCLESHG